jgi:arsenate reductase (thioredoxin)
MAGMTYNVLFLCTGNSARSNGGDAFERDEQGTVQGVQRRQSCDRQSAFAGAGVDRENRLPTAGLRSKNWEEFSVLGAPQMQSVVGSGRNSPAEAGPVNELNPFQWITADPCAMGR